MPVSLAEFTTALTDLKLVTGEQFRDIMSSLTANQLARVDRLAGELISRKILTRYQVQAILSGHSKRLVLGSYLLLDQIGKGGMGVVLKARHVRLKRIVAVKVLSPQVTQNAAALRRFQREVQAISKLEHPNIVVALDADVAGGVHFLVMQYVEGLDLATTVAEQGPLSVTRAVQCLSQAAHGLEYAHQQGITHRDIKPANLLLEKTTGTVKVLDMGLARIDEACGVAIDGETGLTNTGTIMGTVDYMSPEQAANTKKADHRSDIYSLGVTFFYLLTGQLPYSGDTVMEKLLAHREQPIPSLSEFRADIPVAVDALFRKMIAKDPADRFQSMSEVLAALLACLATAPTTVSTSAGGSGRLGVAVAKDSMASEFRDFVNGLSKEDDTDGGYLPGQGTADMSINPRPTLRENPLRPSVSKTGSLESETPRWASPFSRMWIAGSAVVLVLVVILGWGLSRKPAAVPVAKSVKPAKSGVSRKVVIKEDEKEEEEEKLAVVVGPLPELAKVVPLPSGEPGEKLPGLIEAPAKIAGNRRWQVETNSPRSNISAATWSPDSRQVVLGSQTGELRVYDIPGWNLKSLMFAHPGVIRNVAWSREGSRIASTGSDNVVRLWKPDGTPGPTLRQCPSPSAVAWSPDGRYLLAASSDRHRPEIHLFNSDGKPVRLFVGHSAEVYALAWSADGKHFVSASEDATLRVWNLEGETVVVLRGHKKGLRLVTWSSSGAISTVDTAGTVYIYSDTAHPPRVASGDSPRGLAYSPDGTRLAAALGSKIQLWDTDGQINLKQADLDANLIAWSPDGKRLVGCGPSAMVWDPDTGSITALPAAVSPLSLETDPAGDRFVSGHSNGTLCWWQAGGEAAHRVGQWERPVEAIAWSPDGQHVASAARRYIQLWSPQGQPRIDFESQSDVRQLRWSPDSQRLVVAGQNPKVHLLTREGRAGPVLEGHKRNAEIVDWSRHGQIVTVGQDRKILLWTQDGQPGPEVKMGNAILEPRGVVWDPSGRQFAVNVDSKSDTRIKIWNADGTEGPDLKGPKHLVCISWSPDGQRLLGCDHQGEFRSWSRDGDQGPTYPGPECGPRALAWKKDTRLMTAGEDRLVRYWDATNFKPLWLAVIFDNGNTATVSADGRILHSNGQADQIVTYLVERADGRLELFSPEEFKKAAN